jgi:hypothetical protein
MEEITEEMSDNWTDHYLNHESYTDSLTCPFCDSGHIGGTGVEEDEGLNIGEVRRQWICGFCNKKWWEVFTITRIET